MLMCDDRRFFTSVCGAVCRVRKTYNVCTHVTNCFCAHRVFWGKLRNSENKHPNNPLLSAKTVRPSSAYIILHMYPAISFWPIHHFILLPSFMTISPSLLYLSILSNTLCREYWVVRNIYSPLLFTSCDRICANLCGKEQSTNMALQCEYPTPA